MVLPVEPAVTEVGEGDMVPEPSAESVGCSATVCDAQGMEFTLIVAWKGPYVPGVAAPVAVVWLLRAMTAAKRGMMLVMLPAPLAGMPVKLVAVLPV